MNRVAHTIVLDLYKGEQGRPITLKKGETGARRIVTHLVTGKDPYVIAPGVTAQFRAKKPDGTTLYNTAAIEGATVYIDVTTQTVTTPGTVCCELSLLDGEGNLLYSPQFRI
ncbi:MAG: hypothetical protein Q4E65_08505 [Clostridia bacterium]|nr:hypothetical protein [Clostridia bacterium]